jgi:hypothetical protein
MQNIIDEFHYVGDESFFSSTPGKRFKDAVIHHLPKVDNLPIHIGSTGYVHKNEGAELPNLNCWTYDPLHRIVCIFDGYLYFSRYQRGDVIVCGPIYRSTFSDIALDEKLNEISTNITKSITLST